MKNSSQMRNYIAFNDPSLAKRGGEGNDNGEVLVLSVITT